MCIPRSHIGTLARFTVLDTKVAPFPYLMWGAVFTACVVFSYISKEGKVIATPSVILCEAFIAVFGNDCRYQRIIHPALLLPALLYEVHNVQIVSKVLEVGGLGCQGEQGVAN